jgi:hypothetical protein
MTAAAMASSEALWGELRHARSKLHISREFEHIRQSKWRKRAINDNKGNEKPLNERKLQEGTHPKLELIQENLRLKLQLREAKMKISEEYYPPESNIRPEYIQKIKAICAKNEGKVYESMDDFLRSLEE